MVAIDFPPAKPPDDLEPVFFTLQPGTVIRRIYKDKPDRSETSFNYSKASGRFDHHLRPPNSQRGTSYWGYTLSCCLVEVFGDQRHITRDERIIRRIAIASLTQPIKLLDLRKSGAMLVGTNAAIAKAGQRDVTQAWSRYFYENSQVFGEIEGLIFGNAHNEEDAFCFYERAETKFKMAKFRSLNLNSIALQSSIQKIARANGMFWYP